MIHLQPNELCLGGEDGASWIYVVDAEMQHLTEGTWLKEVDGRREIATPSAQLIKNLVHFARVAQWPDKVIAELEARKW